jgi:hypothetical protein
MAELYRQNQGERKWNAGKHEVAARGKTDGKWGGTSPFAEPLLEVKRCE